MSDLNLIPQELKAAEELKKRKIRMIILILAGVLILAALSSIPIYLTYTTELQDGVIKSSINRLSDVKNQVNILNQQKKAVQDRIDTLESVSGGDIKWSGLFEELSMIIPQDISISSITGAPEGITLECSSSSMQSIAVFYANLENDKMFYALKINDITPDSESGILSFSLSLNIAGSEGKVN